jgi:autotransporter-associated beta strand protein
MSMCRVQYRRFALAAASLAALSLMAGRADAQLASFPGAQGFGADATGGRAGSVYVVTNLNDSGAGSFRDAVSQSNRIIVFAVSGSINLQSAVTAQSNLTILGQTAPGGGIAVQGAEVSFFGKSNDIVRYVRFRDGTDDPGYAGTSGTSSSSSNAINLGESTNMILDHVSAEFAAYNNVDASGGTLNLTVSNSIIANPIASQQFNFHNEGTNTTYINNVFANAHNRSVLAKADTQYVNNVVYNYQAAFTTGNSSGDFKFDIVNNYFVAGPSTTSAGDDYYQVDTNQSAYAVGNLLDSNKNGTLDGSADNSTGAVVLASAWSPSTALLPTLSATAAWTHDTTYAGASIVHDPTTYASSLGYDQVDSQVIANVKSNGTSGQMWDSQTQTGLTNNGYGNLNPTLTGTQTPYLPTSTANDGLPDTWAKSHGLSTTSATAATTLNALGYTMIEQYADQIQDLFPTQTATTGEWSTASWTTATPGLYDHAQVRGTGLANGTVTLSGTDAASAYTVSIGGNGPAAGEALVVSGGTLTVQDTVYVGDQNNAGLTMTGGTVRADNVQLGNTVYDANGNPTSYTGTFNFNGGTLQTDQVVLGAGTPGKYTTGGVWNWNGGTLQLYGNARVNAPATLTGTGAIVNTTGPDGAAYTGTMTGILGGTGGLAESGTGVITLAAVNTYSGPTTISSGAIAAAVTNAVSPSSSITVTGGLLQLGNGVTISSPLYIGGSTTSEFVDAPGTANATYAGPIFQTSHSQYRVGDSGTGTLTFTGTTTDGTGYSFITKGNVTFAAGGVLNDTANSGGITVGRNNAEAVSLTVTGTGSAINVPNVPAGSSGLTLGAGTSNESPTVAVTVAGGGAINVAAANVDLDNDGLAATGTIATFNLNAGGTLTAGGFIDSQSAVNASKFNLNGGTLVAGASDPSGGSFLPSFAGLTVAVGSGGAIVNDAGHAVTIAEPLLTGVTSGTDGGLTKLGSGTVALTGASTYTGQTTVSGGALLVSADANLGAPATGAQLNLGTGGTLVGNATATLDNAGANARKIVVGTGGGGLAAATGDTLTVDGTVSGSGALTVGLATVPGTALAGTGVVSLTAPNSFTGGAVLNAGTLQINGEYAVGGSVYGGMTFNGGTLRLANVVASGTAGFNGTADISVDSNNKAKPVTFAAGGATVDTNGLAVTFSGTVGNGGPGGLTKVGAGSLTLAAADSYGGGTAVTAGSLWVNNPSGSGTGTGPVTVAAGATLGGAGTVTGAVTVAGTITAGASNTATGTFTTAGQTWVAGGAMADKLASSGGNSPTVASHDVLVMSGLGVSGLTASGSFAVDVTTVGTGTPVVAAATVIVLATDRDTSATSNPFANSAVLSKLALTVTGTQSATGGFKLATQADTGGGYDLVLEDATAAAPEPTSLLLAAVAAAPLGLGRRRHRRSRPS